MSGGYLPTVAQLSKWWDWRVGMRGVIFTIMLVTTAGTAADQLPFRFTLKPGCALPYAKIAPDYDAFIACDHGGRLDGVAIPDLARRLRAGAKNNLCAVDNEPVLLSSRTLSKLPQLPANHLSSTRAPLANVVSVSGKWIGEGSLVQFVGRLTRAHVDRCQTPPSGQSPNDSGNCHVLGGVITSDIRLAVMPLDAPAEATECDAVTAKIIPHYRPAVWSGIDAKTPLVPVRVRGHLFYDDTARSCVRGKSGAGKSQGDARGFTKWQIHPVYAIDVCVANSPQRCKADDENAWEPYDEWVEKPGSATRATGLRERIVCEEAAAKIRVRR